MAVLHLYGTSDRSLRETTCGLLRNGDSAVPELMLARALLLLASAAGYLRLCTLGASQNCELLYKMLICGHVSRRSKDAHATYSL